MNDFIMHILIGLDSSDYESLVTSVLARGENISLDEFYSLLLSHENRIEQREGKVGSDVVHNFSANITQKNQSYGKTSGSYQRNNGGFFGVGNNFGGFLMLLVKAHLVVQIFSMLFVRFVLHQAS